MDVLICRETLQAHTCSYLSGACSLLSDPTVVGLVISAETQSLVIIGTVQRDSAKRGG